MEGHTRSAPTWAEKDLQRAGGQGRTPALEAEPAEDRRLNNSTKEGPQGWESCGEVESGTGERGVGLEKGRRTKVSPWRCKGGMPDFCTKGAGEAHLGRGALARGPRLEGVGGEVGAICLSGGPAGTAWLEMEKPGTWCGMPSQERGGWGPGAAGRESAANSKGLEGLCAAPELSGRTVVVCQDPAGGAWMKWACGRNLQSYWRAAPAQTGGLRWDGEARLRRWRLGLVESESRGKRKHAVGGVADNAMQCKEDV